MIARLNADAPLWRFKTEVMALVRSIEQQYWNLAQALFQRSSVDRAAVVAREILDKEQAKLAAGTATMADVAEAAQRLENFNLDLAARTSDVGTAERQLRKILGLPLSDNRRIIPMTELTGEHAELKWETCLSQMMCEQPEIAQREIFTKFAELQLLAARCRGVPQSTLHELTQLGGPGQELTSFDLDVTRGFIESIRPVLYPTAPPSENVASPATGSSSSAGTGSWFQTAAPGRQVLAANRTAQYILLRAAPITSKPSTGRPSRWLD